MPTVIEELIPQSKKDEQLQTLSTVNERKTRGMLNYANLTLAGPTVMIVDYKTQRADIRAALQQRLKQGDTWYESGMILEIYSSRD